MDKLLSSVAGVVVFLLMSASASAATIWVPTDVTNTGNVNVLQVDFAGLSLNGGSLALFEDGEDLVAGNALVLGTLGGILSFTDNFDGTFGVEAFVSGVSQGTKVLDGAEFVLGVDWGSGYVSDASAAQDPADPTTYLLSFDDGFNTGTSLVIDVAAIPLPAAAWLFLSAVAGLFGMKARKRA